MNWYLYFEVEVQYGVCCVMFDMLLVEVDFVCLQVLLMFEMQYLIGLVELVKMKCSVILINVLCGLVVDELVFIYVLCNGMICGVGLDVFECELLVVDLLLLVMKNVVVLFYIGLVMYEM